MAERIKKIDHRLRQEFPKYAEFANPEPLSGCDETQKQLKANEALVLFLDTPL